MTHPFAAALHHYQEQMARSIAQQLGVQSQLGMAETSLLPSKATTPPASASEKWEPKIGIWAIGACVHSGVEYTGTIQSLSTVLENTEAALLVWDDGRSSRYVKRSSLRQPGFRPAASAQRIESEYFGTQPDPLPETLPAGTRWDIGPGFADRIGVFTSTAKLVYGDHYEGHGKRDGSRVFQPPAKCIDWTTVTRTPPASAPEGKAQCEERMLAPIGMPQPRCEREAGHSGLCMASSPSKVPAPPATAKGDPDVWGIPRDTNAEALAWFQRVSDCEHRNIVNDTCRDCEASAGQIRALNPREKGLNCIPRQSLDSRIAAARRARHVSDCRASLESDGKARKAAVSTHPKSWPENAGETYELAATEGWSGR